MPLPGGACDKLGNRYEIWWTTRQFIRILHGEAESIRIEDPGVIKAEFVIFSNGQREFHQAKRSRPGGKWSLADLGGPLLQAIFDKLVGNDDRFVFVSGSDAPELRELSERAGDAVTIEEFESHFLKANDHRKNFNKLRGFWANTAPATAYNILRRIEVRTIDERSLEEQVNDGLRALFFTGADNICDALRCIATDSIHKTITRQELIDKLNQTGFILRRLAKPETAPCLIAEVTERYLSDARKKLIGKRLIPRAETQKLIERISHDEDGSDSVLIGKAGTGKTGCIIEFIEALQKRSDPAIVLAFRLDRLAPVSTTVALGRQLGLGESPALVLAAAADKQDAVLVIDQLDAVSTTSGRSSNFIDAVEALLSDVNGLRQRVKLHVVVVCRAFDWHNDHRLRKLLAKDSQEKEIKITEFSVDEVKSVLSAEGFNPKFFNQQHLVLLRLPQNLSMFLDAGFDPAQAGKFNTAKDLYDHYWEEKRRTVSERALPSPDRWIDVIQLLCDEMTRTQQLSVPREKLDRFEPAYIGQMASEGVLTCDRYRYGFGHESFFDYCFARAFSAKEQSLAEFLAASAQHLFHRAQVRQVLTYLRDADRPRYCRELGRLLDDSRVRPHIKDLAMALAVSFPDPGDDDWAVLEPWLKSEKEALENNQRNRDKLATIAWGHFFDSSSWFHLADKQGWISGWLASDRDSLVNLGINYLHMHQSHNGDRVAELLDPYAGKTGEWPQRLLIFIECADLDKSRPFFDLFLRLIDDGTLDEARGSSAQNSTFWSILHKLEEAQPAWGAEVITHRLKRQFILIQQGKDDAGRADLYHLFNGFTFELKNFYKIATKVPLVFVQHVLPIILEITDANTCDTKYSPPKRDIIWPIITFNDHYSILKPLVDALETLAASDPNHLVDIIAGLRRRDTYIANFFLLKLYTAGAAHFADDAAALLCEQPWRFHCGYSDSPYWVANQLIHSIFLFCTTENRVKLEESIMNYHSHYEHTTEGYRLLGNACYALLSGIPPEHRSLKVQEYYRELERKFKEPDKMPVGIKSFTVGSPINKQAAEKMTDEQWLRAIRRYNAKEREFHWDDPARGGAMQLAGMLQELVPNEPERFARLSLKFPGGTNFHYIYHILSGLKGTNAPLDLKLAVCRKAFAEYRLDCGRVIADLLGSIKEPLPEEAVQMLDWLAISYPSPSTEPGYRETGDNKFPYGWGILTAGLNTTRGHAARAIGNLINNDAEYINRFRTTLDCLVSDQSIAVRSMAAFTICAVANHDMALALELFSKLTEADDRLLATQHVDQFIYHGLWQYFPQLQPYIKRMLRSKDLEVSKAGARYASLAALADKDAADLVREAMSGHPKQRAGVATIAANNIADPNCREWCETHLQILFNDNDPEVRQEAAYCFNTLENEPLDKYENLIMIFCNSAAFIENADLALHALEESLLRLPGITCSLCEKALELSEDYTNGNRTGIGIDVYKIIELIMRTYHQHQGDEWARRCLDLIDRLCLVGAHHIHYSLSEYER